MKRKSINVKENLKMKALKIFCSSPSNFDKKHASYFQGSSRKFPQLFLVHLSELLIFTSSRITQRALTHPVRSALQNINENLEKLTLALDLVKCLTICRPAITNCKHFLIRVFHINYNFLLFSVQLRYIF